ncbi:MAG: site-2 protease family protein [Phycisphaerales bacterium]|jgi:Zn-dependent protease
MFGKRIHLFTIFGFQVGIDPTWFLLAVLVAWSLAASLFPTYYRGYSTTTYWWMGIAGALGLFISIVFHEFWHSMVARRYGLPMKGITLFIFGGVAEMEDEPQNAKTELLMAIAGPVSSVVLAGIFLLLARAVLAANWSGPVMGVLQYLGWLNLVLAVFNMLPAFPLDGGRVLRSILWSIKGDLRWSTRIASSIGSGIGIVLIVLGLLTFISGGFIAGIWYFLIGMFIRNAAEMSYRQVILRRALGGEPISRFMQTDPVTVPPSTTVQDLVNNYFYRYHHKMFPVSGDGNLTGCITSQQVQSIPREQWEQRSVQDVLVPCSNETTIPANTDALEALTIMNRTGNSRLMVVDGDHLVGVVTLKDMLKFLSLKIDLEGR